jgi:hypothetical protein
MAAFLLATVSVAAQEVRPVWYVAEFKIRSSDATQWINLVRKYDKPMLDKLMAEGTVLTWGLDAMVIRREDAVTHRIWVVTPDHGGMDKVIAGFNAMKTPPEDVARYLEIANLAALQEHYMRSILFKVTDVPPTARPYRAYSAIKVKPGKGSEWEKLFETYNRPVLDKLLAEAARPGLVDEVELPVRRAQRAHDLAQWLEIARDHAVGADFALPIAIRDRHIDRFFVDIQPYEHATVAHDLPPCVWPCVTP